MNPDQLPIKPGLLFSVRRLIWLLAILVILLILSLSAFYIFHNQTPAASGESVVATGTGSTQPPAETAAPDAGSSAQTPSAVAATSTIPNDEFAWNGGSDKALPAYNEHYMYTQTTADNNRSVDLYYDGKKIDSAWSITSIRLFGDHYAYLRTDNYPNYDLIFDGKNLGEAQYPELWAGNIAYRTYDENGGNTIHYNGEALIRHCTNPDYTLWGNNIAYSCDTDQGTQVYFNKAPLGIGSVMGLQKDLLLIDKENDKTSDLCFVLYKKGIKVDGFWPKNNGMCPGSIASYGDSIGMFGDNYWIMKPTGASKDGEPVYDIDYNGKTVFTTTYPKAVLFGDTFLYGNYNEVYRDGNKVRANSDILSGDALFGNNYFSTVGMNSRAFYNGKALKDVAQNGELYSRLFGDMYLTWSSGNIYKNGAKIDDGAFSTIMALGDNYSYVRQVKKADGAIDGQLMFNGNVVADDFNYVDFKAISGKNIFYKVSASGGNDYLYYRNSNIIGSRYGKADKKIVSDLTIWPEMAPDTEIGAKSANETDALYAPSITGDPGKNTFTDEWLYLTDQWK